MTKGHVNQGICPVQMHCNGITIVEIIDSVNSAIPNLRYRPMIAASVKPYALAMPLAELGKHCASAQGRNCPQTRFRVAGVSQIAAGYIRLGLLWILSTKADDISSRRSTCAGVGAGSTLS